MARRADELRETLSQDIARWRGDAEMAEAAGDMKTAGLLRLWIAEAEPLVLCSPLTTAGLHRLHNEGVGLPLGAATPSRAP